MPLTILEIPPSRLNEYAAVPSRFTVRAVLAVELLKGGLGGILLHETPVPRPYLKDYDACGEQPTDWPAMFDLSRWGFLLAQADGRTVGAAALAFDTAGVFMLEGRRDLAVLWDLRVAPEGRGAGLLLFRQAAEWSRRRGCRQLKIETQNVNLPACRFYQRMGARLGEVRRFGYAATPAVAHEVMLCWYLEL